MSLQIREEELGNITVDKTVKEVKQSKLSRDDDKKLKNLIKKLERLEIEYLEKIDTQGKITTELNSAMGLEENYSDPKKATQIQTDIKNSLRKEEELTDKWEETIMELEEAREKRGAI